MAEEGLTTPGGRPTAAEQVLVEPKAEMESRQARVTKRIWRAKPDERQRTKTVPEGRRSLTDPEGWRDEAQPEEWALADAPHGVMVGLTLSPKRDWCCRLQCPWYRRTTGCQ